MDDRRIRNDRMAMVAIGISIALNLYLIGYIMGRMG